MLNFKFNRYKRQSTTFSWLFITKLAMFALQTIAIVSYLKIRKAWRFSKYIVAAGPASLIAIFAGEMLNSFSQNPYFVAKLADKEFVSSIPQPIRNYLAERLNLELSNPLATSMGLYTLTLVFLVPLLISAVIFLYILLFGKERSEALD